MNIFAVSSNPIVCAVGLDDRRLVKMVLETCQILSTAVWERGGEGPYRRTHVNHPCCVWARENAANYMWTHRLFECLAVEYTYRFGRQHRSWSEHGERLRNEVDLFKDGFDMTPHTQCTPGVESSGDVHEDYRELLRRKWEADGDRARWTRRDPPSWKEMI